MGILQECQEKNSLPFYGFPIQIDVENGILIVNFPDGYTPNGDETKEVADKFGYLLGEIQNLKKGYFEIKLDDNKLAMFIYHSQFEFNYDPDKKKYKASIGSWSF
jgi:hypothetical protein